MEPTIYKPSLYQQNSLFTLTAYFKDGNKFKGHSWRQEVRGKTRNVDHEHAYKRMLEMATRCKCATNKKGCFYCNSTTIILYCNLTDAILYKATYKNKKVETQLHFVEDSKKNVFLNKINGLEVLTESKEHARKNWRFVVNNE
jgi:hypothetical protein